MGAPARRGGLGRGLSALLGEEAAGVEAGEGATDAITRADHTVPLSALRAGRFQPRRRMGEAELEELAASITDKGILQPILVRPDAENPARYEIVAGERRWRAAQKAGLTEVPVLVRELSDLEAMEVGLVENLQRQDLSPLEEAEGYHRLMQEFRRSQEDLARVIGRSRAHIANTIRLLTLPPPVRELVDSGELSAGHARALTGSRNPLKIAKAAIKKSLNVRQTEKLVNQEVVKTADALAAPITKLKTDPNTAALERDLTYRLGMTVKISGGAKGGTVRIHYRSLDELDELLARLAGGSAAGDI